MALALEIKQEANNDIVEAYRYYEGKRFGLGEKFLEHLNTYFDWISENPEHFPMKRKPYREAVLKTFPFVVIFENTQEKVIVYAVFNTWQDPEKKIK